MKSVPRFFAYVILSALFWYMGAAFAIIAMTYSVGLCIAGTKHTARWTVHFLILTAALVAIASATKEIEQILHPILAGVLMFSLLPMIPALFLFAANRIKNQSS